ncbi:MAG: F0F1 ATP synthase subunit B [Treponema sp.]|jgi:F-type H+-transporting ATPase subunit b|nr:F0F1 ATP synthase subunit B [Treponema sp.]
MITPSIATFLITLLNITILFFILRAILFKPVSKFMEKRTKKIEDSIAQAERDKAQAKLLVKRYEDQLKNAENEAEEIIRAARETARQQAGSIVKEGKDQAEFYLINARKQFEAERQAGMAAFKAQAAGLVVAAAARLLKRELTTEDNRQFAEMMLQELGKN